MAKYNKALPKLPERGWLQRGDKGDNVALMQAFLIWAKFSCGKWGADGIFGDATDKAVRDFQKASKIKVDGKWGKETQGVAQSKCETRFDKACAWAKKIAKGKEYNYKRWKSGDEKTHQCPICKKLTGKYKGWNCIGFAFACWHHGAGLKSNCSCGVIGDPTWNKMLKAKTDAEATKIAQKCIGLKDIKVIRNGGKAIPQSQLKCGDILAYYNKNSEYSHTVYYMGDGKIAESTSAKTPNISANRSLTKSWTKLAIRYIGK